MKKKKLMSRIGERLIKQKWLFRKTKWLLKTFKPVRSAWLPSKTGRWLKKLEDGEEAPPGSVLDKQAWDHNYCPLCYETIPDKVLENEGYILRAAFGRLFCFGSTGFFSCKNSY